MTNPNQMPERIYAWENPNGDCWWASEDVVELRCNPADWYIRADLVPDVEGREALERLQLERRLVVNMAERDVQFGDGWLCDYKAWIDDLNKKIDAALGRDEG